MRNLLSQLRVRLILGSLMFLLGLTSAVVLVVRDSLMFSARNMADAGTQALLDQRQASLLEIVWREAELSDHAVHHDPSDLGPLNQRLGNLQLTPNAFAFVMDSDSKLIATASGSLAALTGGTIQGTSLSIIDNPALQEVFTHMRNGESGAFRIDLGTEPVLIAYAPLEETGWSFAIAEPVADIVPSAEPLTEKVQTEAAKILQATLMTIGYFTVVAIIGAVIAARTLTGPIQSLLDGTRSITTGDLSVRIPVKSSDELGVLAESFNQMADELSQRKQETEKINASLLKSEERFRLAIEAAPNAMVMGNEAGRIVLANRQAELLFGYKQDEIIGQPVEMMLPERFYDKHAHLRDQFLEQPESRPMNAMRSTFGRRKDGSEFPAEVAYNPIETEEGVLILGSIVDISERQQLAEARIQAAVEERQRLARELHDSVTQSLYSLTLLAEASRRTASNGDLNKVIDNIARLGETAQQALKEMRLLVYELRPLALETAGLADALQHRLDAVEKRAGVEAKLRVELTGELPTEVENALYRIAQEVLNNSLKHSEANRVQVTLNTLDEQVELVIQDNGKGFNSETVQGGGMGLVNIRERTEAMGGEASIVSQAGTGTQVRVCIPLNKHV
ncbi:MAG TPA: PAS domain S-box protein [Anaerolineales bacterium]|nr:PAS domain S-box protein [Anaerolineales bacterium]